MLKREVGTLRCLGTGDWRLESPTRKSQRDDGRVGKWWRSCLYGSVPTRRKKRDEGGAGGV